MTDDRIEQAKRDLAMIRATQFALSIDESINTIAADNLAALITDLVAENERLNSNIDTLTKYAADYAQQVIDLQAENERKQELLGYYEREYAISEVIAERDEARKALEVLAERDAACPTHLFQDGRRNMTAESWVMWAMEQVRQHD